MSSSVANVFKYEPKVKNHFYSKIYFLSSSYKADDINLEVVNKGYIIKNKVYF